MVMLLGAAQNQCRQPAASFLLMVRLCEVVGTFRLTELAFQLNSGETLVFRPWVLGLSPGYIQCWLCNKGNTFTSL